MCVVIYVSKDAYFKVLENNDTYFFIILYFE